ncbi:MAG: hypothetical protein AAF965_12100 [Pseudomonadota bacterium]
MADFTGADVNAVLRLVTSLATGVDASAGNKQISILAVALCTAARDCGVPRDQFIQNLARAYDDVLTRPMVPLHGSERGH